MTRLETIRRERDPALEVMIHVIERGIIDQGLIAEMQSRDTLLEDIEMIAVQIQGTVTTIDIGEGLGLMRDTEDTTGQGLDLMKTVEEEENLQRDKYLLSLEIFTRVES